MILAEKEMSLKTDLRATSDISYDRYRKLGGIINKDDYDKALAKASITTSLSRALITQAKMMACTSGISLNNSGDRLNKITILYGVLRTDKNPGVEYYHSQMTDQRLFAETLRMLDCPDLLRKFVRAHFHVFFAWDID